MGTDGPKSSGAEKGFVMMDGEPEEGAARAAGEDLPKIDFSTFVLSLGTSDVP